MKNYFKSQAHILKHNWKCLSIKFAINIFAVYLFALAISLYMNTKVGVSHIDIFIFSLMKVKNIEIKHYSTYLLYFYLMLFAFLIILRMIKIIKVTHYNKKTNQQLEKYWVVEQIFDLFCQIIPVFLWPLFIRLNLLYIDIEKIGKLDDWSRGWIFWLGYSLYCISFGIIVFSNILFGPYNGISNDLATIIPKLNYSFARIIIDVIIAACGILILFCSSLTDNQKMDFLKNRFSYGTVMMTIFSGPIIGYISNKLNKWSKNKLKLVK